MTLNLPWVRIRINDREFHVWPPNDSKEHKHASCPCNPTIEIEKKNRKILDKAVVHKAWDDRPAPLE